MAVAVRTSTRRETARPRLELVKPTSTRARAKSAPARRSSAAECARWRSGFRTYLLVLAALAVVACGRVALTSRAAEATLASANLERDIKQERLAGDKLEISRSSLTTPSRIRDIAGVSLQMVEPGTVEYLDVPEETLTADTAETGGAGGLREVIATAMDLAAGEAQVLLVGDVGLASTR